MRTYINSLALPVPEKLSLTEDSREIIMEKKWFSMAHIGTFLFALFWNSLIFFFYAMMIAGNVSIIILLFPVMHLIAGIWLFYYSICGFFNKTIISANKMEVSIKFTPMPWMGEKLIERSQILQFYIIEQTKKQSGTAVHTYDVQVLIKENKTISLITGLETPGEALFIEKKLEQFLHIENQPVEGAYSVTR